MTSWLGFVVALLLALAVPGPDLVVVVQSATRGVREGASTAAGVVTGLTLHAALAIAGATALLMSVPHALNALRVLGAAVLLWMGVSMIRPRPETGPAAAGLPRGSGYGRGFLINATNPKALLFFAAILPQFIRTGEGAHLRTLTLCATVVLGAGLWWAVTIALVRLLGFQRSATADRLVSLVGGVALILIAGALLVTTAVDYSLGRETGSSSVVPSVSSETGV